MGENIPGDNFLGVNFLGGNSTGGSLIGGNFLGGNFPGGSFPNTLSKTLSAIVKMILKHVDCHYLLHCPNFSIILPAIIFAQKTILFNVKFFFSVITPKTLQLRFDIPLT